MVVTGIVLAAAALRIAPHPMNFAPIGALHSLAEPIFSSKRAAFVFPLLSLIAGDIFIGFHRLFLRVCELSCERGDRILAEAEKVGATHWRCHGGWRDQFFLVTNFAVWVTSTGTYPKNAGGLAACYIAGNTVLLEYAGRRCVLHRLLFGGMALAERRFPSLREPLAAESVN